MIQICGKPIRKTLELITNQRTDTGSSPLKWEKANVVSIHKKDNNNNEKLPIRLTIFGSPESTLETNSC